MAQRLEVRAGLEGLEGRALAQPDTEGQLLQVRLPRAQPVRTGSDHARVTKRAT